MSTPKIQDFKQCPHCNSNEGYYQKIFISGWVMDRTTFAGKKENTEIFDSLKYSKYSKFYFCEKCHKKICKVD